MPGPYRISRHPAPKNASQYDYWLAFVFRKQGLLSGQALAASRFATLAGVGAFLAMLHVGTVFGAFVAASFADFGALL